VGSKRERKEGKDEGRVGVEGGWMEWALLPMLLLWFGFGYMLCGDLGVLGLGLRCHL